MLPSFRSIISALMIAMTAITGSLILTSPDEVEALQLETADEIEALQLENADLRRQVTVHRTCAVYGVLTRTALEEDWTEQRQTPDLAICFFDIDYLKILNTELGQDETNRRINQAFSVARSNELIKLGRFFSGDEFLILAPKNQIVAACDRVMAALGDHGISATAVVVLYEGQETLADAVRKAGDLVTQCKAKEKGKTYNFLPS